MNYLYETFGISPDYANRPRRFNLAGYDKKDVDIKVVRNTLSVVAENKEMGKTEYIATVPQHVDPKKIKAELNNGLLTIKYPKEEDEQLKISVD